LRSIPEVMQVQGMCFTTCSALWVKVCWFLLRHFLLSPWKEIRLVAVFFLVRNTVLENRLQNGLTQIWVRMLY